MSGTKSNVSYCYSDDGKTCYSDFGVGCNNKLEYLCSNSDEIHLEHLS